MFKKVYFPSKDSMVTDNLNIYHLKSFPFNGQIEKKSYLSYIITPLL